MNFVFIILFVLFLAVLFSFAYGAVSGAPWIPTRKIDIARVIEVSGIGSGDKFYEMGSGDGRLGAAVVAVGGKFYGYEVAFLPYIVSKINGLFLKNKENYVVRYKSFWHADISDADFVYVFLVPWKNSVMAEKLRKEMKKGSKIIAYVWPFEGWEPLKVDRKKDRVNIYLYEI